MFIPVKIGNRWGFIDEDGHLRISAIYDQLGDFAFGVASFRVDSNIGFMNEQGEQVIAAKFDSTANRMPLFKEGLAAISENKKSGFINLRGDWEISPDWAKCWDCFQAKALVESMEGYFVIRIDSKDLIAIDVYDVPFLYDWPTNWECFRCFFRADGRLLTGFLNWKGDTVFTPRYPWVTDFCEGVAGFCEYLDDTVNPFGLVNSAGVVLQDPRFFCMSDFEEGLARAGRTPKEFGFINSKGEWVIEPKYRQVQPFSDGLACVTVKGKQGFINTKGEMLIEPRFNREASFRNGFAQVEYERKRAVIDKTGRVIWETDARGQ